MKKSLLVLLVLFASVARADIVVSCDGGDFELDRYSDARFDGATRYTAIFNDQLTPSGDKNNEAMKGIPFAEFRGGNVFKPQVSGLAPSIGANDMIGGTDDLSIQISWSGSDHTVSVAQVLEDPTPQNPGVHAEFHFKGCSGHI